MISQYSLDNEEKGGMSGLGIIVYQFGHLTLKFLHGKIHIFTNINYVKDNIMNIVQYKTRKMYTVIKA